jgi:hypothetical protein
MHHKMEHNSAILEKKNWILILSILFVLVCIHQNFLLRHFSFKVMDSDQAILWLAAKDISMGNFITPYFYGQSYNIMLEAFLGAGFITLGLPVQKAVPLAANLIAFIPWLCAFLIGIFRKHYWLSLSALVFYLIQPVELHMVMAMPRGFSNGLAVFSVGTLLLFLEKGKGTTAIGFFLVFLSPLINANMAVIGLPIGLFVLWREKDTWRSHVLPVLSALILVAFIFFSLKSFNETHPMYDLHRFSGLTFSPDKISDAFLNGYHFFKGLSPFLYEIGVAVWFILIGFLLWLRPKRVAFNLYSVFLIFFIFTLGINKVHDGTSSIFFPYLRMFLGLPFALMFFFVWRSQSAITKKHVYAMLGTGAIGFAVLMLSFFGRLGRGIKTNSGVVQVKYVKDLCQACDDMEQLQKKYDAEVLVFHSKADEYNYGCKALNLELNTVHPHYERRIWTYHELMKSNPDRVLFFDWYGSLEDVSSTHLSRLEESYPVYLLQDYPLSLEEFYKQHQLELRKYTE